MATSTSTVTSNSKKPSILVTVAKKTSTASGSLHHTRLSFSVPSRSLFGASSRKSITLHGDSKILDKASPYGIKPTVKVYDDQGFDVTPRPLFHLEPGATISKQSKIFAQDVSVMTTYDFVSTASAQTAVNASFVGPFTRSTFGGATGTKSSRTDSLTDAVEEDGSRLDISVSLSDIHVRREEVREYLTEQDLNKNVDVFLTETSTIWIFDMPAILMSVDAEDAENVKLKNAAYEELCKNRAGNDRYIERMMQTLSGAPKHKEVQSERIVLNDAAIMATTWDLYDSISSLESASSIMEVEPKTHKPRSSAGSSKTSASHTQGSTTIMSKTASSGTQSTIMDVEHIILARIPEDTTEGDAAAILHSEKFQDDLFFMERIIMENNFQSKLAIYRQLPILTDPDVNVGVVVKKVCPDTSTLSLNRLWSFACELTKGHNVSSTAWNRKNPDLLAVGYGQFGFKEQRGGFACCWSLKNPTWPERILNCESGVTALDFSAANPNLLAIGMYNGTVAIYNVQNNFATPVMDSSESNGKHTSPVWQLKWLDQEKCTFGEEKGELLVSVSGDGRITRWFMRKTLDCSDLMKLKRIGTEKTKKSSDEKEKKIEAFIFRRAPGMCFDFHPKDANIYLAGTEEGHIHKCSCSYNEQFLETYRTHKGPVYKIAWSPFCHDVFLSCSADWNIHLWVENRLKPVLTFSSVTTAVCEIMWSPYSAVVFGAVNENRVEIWDLHVSTLDPVLVNVPNPGVTFTTILFAKNTNCVLIGDSDGHVGVYEMRNVCITETSQVEELNDIIATTLASQLEYEALG